jgi:hypothetical protein
MDQLPGYSRRSSSRDGWPSARVPAGVCAGSSRPVTSRTSASAGSRSDLDTSPDLAGPRRACAPRSSMNRREGSLADVNVWAELAPRGVVEAGDRVVQARDRLRERGGLLAWRAGVPARPDRAEVVGPQRRDAGAGGLQLGKGDLGAAAKVGQYLCDRPVGAVGLAGQVGFAEPVDTGGQLIVAAAQRCQQAVHWCGHGRELNYQLGHGRLLVAACARKTVAARRQWGIGRNSRVCSAGSYRAAASSIPVSRRLCASSVRERTPSLP